MDAVSITLIVRDRQRALLDEASERRLGRVARSGRPEPAARRARVTAALMRRLAPRRAAEGRAPRPVASAARR